MTVINRVIKGLEFLRNHEKEIIKDIIVSKSKDIEDLQKDQLLRGKTRNEKNIEPRYRNDRYARKKQSMNSKPAAGVPDLKLTGRYHRAFKTKVSGEKVTIINTDKKDAMLTKKYQNVKGLSNLSIAKLREVAVKDLRKKFKQVVLA